MRFLIAFTLSFAAVLLITSGHNAHAQSAACNQFRAELAALDRAGSGGGQSAQFGAAAPRQSVELQRTVNYARQLGCDRGGLFNTAPAECGAINAQISRMRANLSQLEAQADNGGVNPARRQQLLAAIDRACRVAPVEARPQQPRGLFDALFGGGNNAPPQDVPQYSDPRRNPYNSPNQINPMPELDGQIMQAEDDDGFGNRRLGGGRAVCVRTCDGFFFPVSVLPEGRRGANEMCQSLCPGTETKAYFMSSAGEIQDAVASDGTPYRNLANAAKYQTNFDPACGCRKIGQTWAEALRQAEALLDRRKGDIFVTEAKAEELSRFTPKDKKADDKSKDKKGKNKPVVPEATATVEPSANAASDVADPASVAEAAAGAAAPTASQESSGIGPQTIDAQSVASKATGNKIEVALPNGEKRVVRVIGTGQQPVN